MGTKEMTTKEMMTQIVMKLCDEPLLSDFKYIKSEESFKLKVGDGWYKLTLFHNRLPYWWFKSLDGSEVAVDILSVTPTVFRRFDAHCKWYDEFLNWDKRDIPKAHSMRIRALDYKKYGIDGEFYFSLTGCNFNQEYRRLYLMIEVLLEDIFKYHSLEALYEKNVKKYLTTVPDNFIGVDWVFYDLFLCRVVDPDNYQALNNVMENHLAILKKDDEPNYRQLEPKIPEIIAKLERVGDEYRAKYKPSPNIDHDPIWDTIQDRLNSHSNH